MRVVGRKREKDQGEPKGVRTIAGRWYWQPPTEVERAQRRAKGLSASVPLGKAGTVQARMKWSELTGIRDDAANPGTIADLLTRFNEGDAAPILTQRNGRPRSVSTVAQYRRRLPALYKKLGAKVYGRTESDVMRGKGINAGELQKIIRSSGSLGRSYLAILDAAFDDAILCGLTTYNPCASVTALAINPRTREPLEWELECLGTLARPVIGLILETKAISGYRISEVLRAHRRDMHDWGIRFTVKGSQDRDAAMVAETARDRRRGRAAAKGDEVPGVASLSEPPRPGLQLFRLGVRLARSARRDERGARRRRHRPGHARAPRGAVDRGPARARRALQGPRRRERHGAQGTRADRRH
jgi:hypothetical protein